MNPPALGFSFERARTRTAGPWTVDRRTSDNGARSVPPASTRQIDRSRLLDRLDGIPGRPLTVVTAPMGSGKTNLVARWCAERCPLSVTWLAAGDDLDLALKLADAEGADDRVVVVDGLGTDADAEQVARLARATGSEGSVHLVLISRRRLTSVLGEWRLDPLRPAAGVGPLAHPGRAGGARRGPWCRPARAGARDGPVRGGRRVVRGGRARRSQLGRLCGPVQLPQRPRPQLRLSRRARSDRHRDRLAIRSPTCCERRPSSRS